MSIDSKALRRFIRAEFAAFACFRTVAVRVLLAITTTGIMVLAFGATGRALAADSPEDIFWKSVKRNNDPVEYRLYIKQFPKGKYVSEARRRIAEKSAMVPGQIFKDCAECPEMVVIPAGRFDMGDNASDHETPVHSVRIVKPFALGKTEVTQGQWRSVMGSNPSHFSSCGDDCPVENVSWDDAKTFVQRLNAKTRKSYRLPSEAEWEYACRAGGTYAYCGSESVSSVAWYSSNSDRKTHSAAGKQANAWGLHDMSGNVWEWTEDCWNDSYNGAPSDGSAWTSGTCGVRVFRGGSWDLIPQFSRASIRFRGDTSFRVDGLGFRLARMLEQDAAPKPNSVQGGTTPGILAWAESDNGADINWNDATSYCASKGSGWRLPTVSELRASYQSGHSTPCGATTCKVSSNSRLTGTWFWTNELWTNEHNVSSLVWVVYLVDGGQIANHVGSRGSRALCVRRP